MALPDWTRRIEEPLAGSGLFLRGAFHPAPDDGVPPLADGQPAATVVLIGNAGNDLWRAFRASGPDMSARHPLDGWVAGHLRAAADALGAEFVDAMRPPWPPIQQWAVRAGAGHRSPINLVIHPEFGLWHTFRGALLTAEKLPLPDAKALDNPCETCAGRPCLTTCPADAFALPENGPADGPEEVQANGRFADFDSPACVDHVESPAGRGCRTVGCLARRACPVGRPWAYDREPAAYHMAAVVRTVRRWQAKQAR